MERCDRVVVDSVPQAQRLSRELTEYFGPPDGAGWKQVAPLSSLVAAREPRDPAYDLTLFKSLGMGVSDLALGVEIYRKALENGTGREFPRPRKVSPRLRAGKS